jgi:hypothetical protein
VSLDERERASFRACATTVRQIVDQGGIPGVAPSAMFVLCRMLETAASDPAQLSARSRLELRNVMVALRVRAGEPGRSGEPLSGAGGGRRISTGPAPCRGVVVGDQGIW